jgi:hypothetical protein
VENNNKIKKSIGTNELTPHLILIVIQPFRKALLVASSEMINLP